MFNVQSCVYNDTLLFRRQFKLCGTAYFPVEEGIFSANMIEITMIISICKVSVILDVSIQVFASDPSIGVADNHIMRLLSIFICKVLVATVALFG